MDGENQSGAAAAHDEPEVLQPTPEEMKELEAAFCDGTYLDPLAFLEAIKADGSTPLVLKERIKAMLRLYDIAERGGVFDDDDESEVEKE